MARQTMTVISGPRCHKQLSQPFLCIQRGTLSLCSFSCFFFLSQTLQPCIPLLIRRQRGSDGWWQMNLQTAVAGDRAPLVELPHCNHVTVNKLQKTSFSATLFIRSCVPLDKEGRGTWACWRECNGYWGFSTRKVAEKYSRSYGWLCIHDFSFLLAQTQSDNTPPGAKRKNNQTRILICLCLISDRENVSGCHFECFQQA